MRAGIFGRAAELGVIGGFLDDLPARARALLLTGPAGAGKTTLLTAAAEDGKGRGLVVLTAGPAQSELRLAFAGLADLLGPWLDEVLPVLPAPQRRALGVALLIEDAPPVPPDPRVIAAALHGALAALARRAPVLAVVDDVQWLDAPTEAALRFAFRRLVAAPVGLLCALRDARPGAELPGHELPLGLGEARLETELLPLGGLSLGALHHLLRLRLGTSFSHPMLRRIEGESGGNPFIALEIARALARRGVDRVPAGSLPVPDTLSGLVRERLQLLPASVLEVLGIVAVMPGAPLGRYLEAGADGGDLDTAVLAGVLDTQDGRLRFAHPLLASAVLGAIPPVRQRDLHAIAARSAELPEERARHRALAADGPSAATAALLDDAAAAAAARGAPATAAELLELAASLTGTEHQAQAHGRLLDAARQLSVAGETRAAARVLEQLIAVLPPGSRRAEALGQLASGVEDDFEASARLLWQALAEAGDDQARTAEIHIMLSDSYQARDDMPQACAEAHHAVEDAERAGRPALLAAALAQAFFMDWLVGADVHEDQLERALRLEEEAGSQQRLMAPSQVAGQHYLSLGRIEEADAMFARALARAEADGVEYWRADTLLRMSLGAAWSADLERSARCAAAGLEIAEQLDLAQLTSALLYACGFTALQRGDAAAVRELAGRGLELSRSVGEQTYAYFNEALLGSLELALGDYAAAAARLAPLAGRGSSVGRSVTRQNVTADAIEALIAAGQREAAASLLAELERGACRPVLDPVLARCQGELAAAAADLDGAVSILLSAVALHDRIEPQPVQRGRTLLVLGAVQRRLKQRRAARETLTEAIETFGRVGAALWDERGRAELARVSGRTPAPAGLPATGFPRAGRSAAGLGAAGHRAGQSRAAGFGVAGLTATERRVADLIAEGKTNKEAAADLFVTVRAIESTLTKIYAKLGVRSRTQLISQLHRDR